MSATITQDETIRTITVYNPDGLMSSHLSDADALATAIERIAEEFDEPRRWTHLDFDRINYDRVAVRFQRL